MLVILTATTSALRSEVKLVALKIGKSVSTTIVKSDPPMATGLALSSAALWALQTATKSALSSEESEGRNVGNEDGSVIRVFDSKELDVGSDVGISDGKNVGAELGSAVGSSDGIGFGADGNGVGGHKGRNMGNDDGSVIGSFDGKEVGARQRCWYS